MREKFWIQSEKLKFLANQQKIPKPKFYNHESQKDFICIYFRLNSISKLEKLQVSKKLV